VTVFVRFIYCFKIIFKLCTYAYICVYSVIVCITILDCIIQLLLTNLCKLWPQSNAVYVPLKPLLYSLFSAAVLSWY